MVGSIFVCLRGGEDELHMGRRLFQRLEQRVEGAVTEHVDFIYVVDAELPAGRCVVHRLPQGAHIIHTVIGGPVYLRHVETAPLRDFHAHILIRIKINAWPAGAVERFGKNARGTCLSGAPRADER